MVHMQEARWAGHGSDWPEGHRLCMTCKVMQPISEFHKHKLCKGGHNSVCKTCRKLLSSQQYKNSSKNYRLWYAAKSRATLKGREFSIELLDIEIPTVCPVLGIPMKSPSIDRIDSSKGYVKGNIRVISRRANTLKNNATVNEMRLVLADLERLERGEIL